MHIKIYCTIKKKKKFSWALISLILNLEDFYRLMKIYQIYFKITINHKGDIITVAIKSDIFVCTH